MDEEEIKEWDNALLDLVNKGLVKIVKTESGEVGFQLNASVLIKEDD